MILFTPEGSDLLPRRNRKLPNQAEKEYKAWQSNLSTKPN